MFEKDWIDLRQKQKSRKMVSKNIIVDSIQNLNQIQMM